MKHEFEVSFKIAEEQVGNRLDFCLAAYLNQLQDSDEALDLGLVPTRSKCSSWISEGRVTLDNQTVYKSASKLKFGSIVRVFIPQPAPLKIESDSSVEFQVVFEDNDILVVDKPPGIVVHPGAGVKESTLVHGLLAHLGNDFLGVGANVRPGIVHRLDKDTSGLLVVAKNDLSYQALVKQFLPPRTISREYLALVRSLPKHKNSNTHETQGIICAPIGRDPKNRKKMAVLASGGKEAITKWQLEKEFSGAYLLRVRLETGRTHQIRVHLQSQCAPIIGDSVYGEALKQFPAAIRSDIKRFGRQALHAAELGFVHPSSGKMVVFNSPLAKDFSTLISCFQEKL